MKRLQSLQILRFVAAVGVVHSHAWGIINDHPNIGAAGVDVFFVLSGFIVSLTSREKPEGFLRNRLIRVLPIYYLASLPLIITHAANGTLGVQQLLATVTLWPAYERQVTPVLYVAWTLSFELLFYMALAAVIAGVRPWMLLAAYAACWLAAMATGWPVFRFLGAPIIIEFLMGVGLGLLNVRSRVVGAAAVIAGLSAYAWLVATGADATIAAKTSADPREFIRVAACGLPAAALVFGFMQFEAQLKGRVAAAFAFLGDASYSLYLFHPYVLAVFGDALPQVGALPVVLVCVALSVLIYRCVEAPVLRAARRVTAPKPHHAAAHGPNGVAPAG